jgi:transposase
MLFEGKNVYTGIDVHRRSYSICCRCDGQVVKIATLPAVSERLVEGLKRWFRGAEIHCVYEAGFSGLVLHRQLVSAGIDSVVVNAASVEIAANDKVKTDKRDCKKLSIQLEAGRLRGIHIPTIEQEQQRLFTRTREQLVRHRTQLSNQFRNRLHQFGMLHLEDRRQVSRKFIEHYLSLELPFAVKEALSAIADVWKSVDGRIKSLEKTIKEQGNSDPHEAIYRSVPGVGSISARILSNELGDMSQFKNERQLFCHTGLTPSEYSSAERRRQGHISRQGSSRLRFILTEIAWRAIKEDEKLAQDFRRISHNAGKKRAIVAIARKLAGRIRACFKAQRAYQPGFGLAA